MLFLLQDGITNGAIYALLGLALVLVFAVTRVILIPQGEFVTYGALSYAMLATGQVPGTAGLAVAMAHSAPDGFALSVTDYESSLHDPRVKQLEQLVRCEVHPEVEAATTAEAVPARVTVTMKDGTKHSTFVPAPKGSPSRPFTHADHVARFRRELGKRLTEKSCDEMVHMAENLADLDKVERVTELLAVARAR